MNELNADIVASAQYFDPMKPVLEWSEPKPIKTELTPVKELDTSIIPEPLRKWIVDSAYRMSAPPDGIAIAAIVTASSVVGTGCAIRPKRKDDWTVVPNLWGALVDDVSRMKTSQLLQGTAPLKQLEDAANADHAEAIRSYEIESDLYKNQRQGLLSQARAKAADISDLKTVLQGLKEPQKPRWKRYQTNDSSIEKLNELLAENPRGIQIFRDELAGFLSTMEMQGHEADRAYYLEGWNGTGRKTDDRIGRGTIIAPNVCLSILGGIQPDKLDKYLYDAAYGMQNDGFIQRFQLLVYPNPTDWKYVDEAPDVEARKRAFEVFERLATMQFTVYGAKQEPGDPFAYMQFTDEAQRLYVRWMTQHKMKELLEPNALLRQHLSKYGSLMPSLALLFHLIEIADGMTAGMVTERSAANAVAWCEYLESHARRIYGLIGSLPLKAASCLAEKLSAGELTDGFTAYEVRRKGWRFLKEHDIVKEALDELVDLGWLQEQRTQPSFQQKAKVMYFINPSVIGRQKSVGNGG